MMSGNVREAKAKVRVVLDGVRKSRYSSSTMILAGFPEGRIRTAYGRGGMVS